MISTSSARYAMLVHDRPAGFESNDPLLDDQVRAAQLRMHYSQIPVMVIAPTAGAFYTAWVLWDAVDNHYISAGLLAVSLLAAARIVIYRQYWRHADRATAARWRYLAVAGAGVSGCIWGSAAPFLYPPIVPGYEVFLIALLTLLPIVPVAALASYLPAFYAYYLPCLLPFIVTLALQDSRAEHLTALLLVMMMGAMLAFARSYSRSLVEAIRLRVQLVQKSEALQAAFDNKMRFIAGASHDLRQPVHAMGLFLAGLREHGVANAALDESLRHLEASQRSLRDMLGNLLDQSRFDAQVVEPKLRNFAIGEMTQQLCAEFSPQAARMGIELRCRPCNRGVRSDPVLLERALRNLLSNALKYTRRGGVLLACRRRGSVIRVQVFDTGIGIHVDQHEAVFAEFSRIEQASEDDTGGLGLGLAIVRQTMRLLDHPLQLHSVPGRGSVFSIDIPAVVLDQISGSHASVADSGKQVPAMLVMIIDDDIAVRVGTAALVEAWGHRTIACASTDQALAALKTEPPDLLLVDFRLARSQSGPQAVAAIEAAVGHSLPVILITGDTAPNRIREAYDAGHFLLHKPVDAATLRVCLAEVMSAGASSNARLPALPRARSAVQQAD